MEARQNDRREHSSVVADLSGQVLVALDQLTPDERVGIFAAIAHGERDGTCVPGAEPLYALRAAPEVVVFVHREQLGGPVTAVDILRPAALRTLGHAG